MQKFWIQMASFYSKISKIRSLSKKIHFFPKRILSVPRKFSQKKIKKKKSVTLWWFFFRKIILITGLGIDNSESSEAPEKFLENPLFFLVFLKVPFILFPISFLYLNFVCCGKKGKKRFWGHNSEKRIFSWIFFFWENRENKVF